MPQLNPYSTSVASQEAPRFEATSVGQKSPSTKRLWVSYLIAPFVAPMMSAIVLGLVGLSFQAAYQNDVDTNPMSIVLAPLFLLLIGIPISYGVAGLIGMPIAFWLRRRGALNGYTVHGAALLLAAFLGAVVVIVELLSAWLTSTDILLQTCVSLLASGVVVTLGLAPFVLLTATTFWLIGVRQWKRSA